MFFFKRELELASRIFKENHISVFENLFDSHFSLFCETVINLNKQVTAHTDILFDIDVLDTLTEIMQKTDFHPDKYLIKISQLAHGFNGNIEITLMEFMDGVEHHDPSDIPPSGAVSALTSNSIQFLSKLSKNNLMQVGRISIPKFTTNVIVKLQKNIKEKVSKYFDGVAAQLFIMNNAHYTYTSIVNDQRLKAMISENILHELENDIQNAQAVYMKLTWNVVFSCLEHDKAFNDWKKEMPLNNKQKEVIKHKFLTFTDSIIKLRDRHEKYAQKNEALVAPIKKEARNKIHTKYEPFYHRFTKVSFSNHPEKYCKLIPSTVDDFVRSMYDKRVITSK